jgi:hypothetical protein
LNRGDVRPGAALSSLGEYDLLVIGSDGASRRTALEAARAGLRVVVVEAVHLLPEAAKRDGDEADDSSEPRAV